MILALPRTWFIWGGGGRRRIFLILKLSKTEFLSQLIAIPNSMENWKKFECYGVSALSQNWYLYSCDFYFIEIFWQLITRIVVLRVAI